MAYFQGFLLLNFQGVKPLDSLRAVSSSPAVGWLRTTTRHENVGLLCNLQLAIAEVLAQVAAFKLSMKKAGNISSKHKA